MSEILLKVRCSLEPICISDSDEVSPSLLIWNTIDRDSSTGLKQYSFDEKLNAEFTITIYNIKTSQLRKDDSILCELVVSSKNDEGIWTGSRAGCGRCYLFDILNKSEDFSIKIPLFMPNASNDDEHNSIENKESACLKAYINLFFDIKKSKISNGFTFKEKTRFDVLPENEGVINNAIDYCIGKGSYYFTHSSTINNLNFPSSSSEEEHIHAFRFSGIVDLPAQFYFTTYSIIHPSEEFYENLIRIILSRESKTEKWFIEAINHQIESKSDSCTYDFKLAISYIGKCCSLPSCSMRYKSDETYIRKGGAITKLSIESFDDPLTMGLPLNETLAVHKELNSINLLNDPNLRVCCGDCEECGLMAVRIFSVLENMNCKSELVKSMQMITNLYTMVSILGSVTNPAYQDSLNKGHSQDGNDRIGAHMYGMMIPNSYIISMNKSVNSKCNLNIGSKHVKFSHDLPVCIIEGTAYFDNLALPLSMYTESDGIDRSELLSCYSDIMSKSETCFQNLVLEKKQWKNNMTQSERFSAFYINAVSGFTDKFFKHGYNFGEFYFVDNTTAGILKYTVDVQKILMKSPEIGIIIKPGFTKKESIFIKSLMRHLRPIGQMKCDKKEYQYVIEVIDKYCDKFNSLISSSKKKITNEITNNERIKKTVGFIRFPECVDEIMITKIANDMISNINTVISCKASTEMIMNDLFVMRLDIYYNANISESKIDNYISNNKTYKPKGHSKSAIKIKNEKRIGTKMMNTFHPLNSIDIKVSEKEVKLKRITTNDSIKLDQILLLYELKDSSGNSVNNITEYCITENLDLINLSIEEIKSIYEISDNNRLLFIQWFYTNVSGNVFDINRESNISCNFISIMSFEEKGDWKKVMDGFLNYINNLPYNEIDSKEFRLGYILGNRIKKSRFGYFPIDVTSIHSKIQNIFDYHIYNSEGRFELNSLDIIYESDPWILEHPKDKLLIIKWENRENNKVIYKHYLFVITQHKRAFIEGLNTIDFIPIEILFETRDKNYKDIVILGNRERTFFGGMSHEILEV